jgi:glutaredoxin-related protein
MTNLSSNRCRYVCEWMMQGFFASVFERPVQWEELGLHDYPQKIKNPMDFYTLLDFVESESFSFDLFVQKANLIWSNGRTYNGANHPIYTLAEKYEKAFDDKIKQCQQHPSDDDPGLISQHLLSLVLSFFQEDYAVMFCSDNHLEEVDIEDYAKNIHIHFNFEDIVTNLSNMKYYNRNDVKDDVHHVLNNALQYYNVTTLFGKYALHTKEVFDRLFDMRKKDVDSMVHVPQNVRLSLNDMMVELNDDARLQILHLVTQLCPDAIENTRYKLKKDVPSVAISWDMLNCEQFVRVYTTIQTFKDQDCVSGGDSSSSS